jgi:hypothetical protein
LALKSTLRVRHDGAHTQIWVKMFMLSVFSREINAGDARLVLSIDEKEAQGGSYSAGLLRLVGG